MDLILFSKCLSSLDLISIAQMVETICSFFLFEINTGAKCLWKVLSLGKFRKLTSQNVCLWWLSVAQLLLQSWSDHMTCQESKVLYHLTCHPFSFKPHVSMDQDYSSKAHFIPKCKGKIVPVFLLYSLHYFQYFIYDKSGHQMRSGGRCPTPSSSVTSAEYPTI